MTRASRDRAARACLGLAALSAAWAIVVALTGGVGIDAPIRLSSRTPRNPAIIATAGAVLAWLFASPVDRRGALIAVRRRARLIAEGTLHAVDALPAWIAPAFAAALSIAVCATGIVKGTNAAGGADSYAYVSQAEMWSRGQLRIEQPLMSQLAWPYARDALSPLGYRPARQGAAIVPVYGPGLPMMMGLLERVAGRSAVFSVVPVLGGLAIWATYLMGARLAGPGIGAMSAVLLATAPVFLYQLVQPMTDVPATALWALTLALLADDRPGPALAAGLSAGLAILTRANLIPLLAVVAGVFLWQANAGDPWAAYWRRRVMLFAAGVAPGCVLAFALNAYWIGAPFEIGHGSLGYLFDVANFRPNVVFYSRWLLDSQTPVILLAVAAPFLLAPLARVPPDPPEKPGPHGPAYRSRALALVWLAFAAAVFACYMLYVPFDAWWYLRYLLPAFPALTVLTAAGMFSIAKSLAGRAGGLAAGILVAAIAWHGVSYAAARDTFRLQEGERKYPAVGRYVADHLPERAVLLSIQHSGSLRYYSGRLTIRYDRIPPAALDSSLEDLRRLGYRPYIALEDDEAADFRARFGGHSAVAALDWMPLARLRRPLGVAIYDPAAKSGQPDRGATTDVIDDSAAAVGTPAR